MWASAPFNGLRMVMEGGFGTGAVRSCRGKRRETTQRNTVSTKLSAAKIASPKFMIVAGDLSTSGQKMSGSRARCQLGLTRRLGISQGYLRIDSPVSTRARDLFFLSSTKWSSRGSAALLSVQTRGLGEDAPIFWFVRRFRERREGFLSLKPWLR